MASGDGNQDPEGPPDFHGTPFRWGSLLSAVRDQIPSMDSDVSLADSDEDGELFLFQRDHSNLIPDLTEELEDLPLEESYYLQETFSFMRHPQEMWYEDLRSLAFQNEGVPPSDSGDGLLLDLRSQNEEDPSQDAISSLEFSINEQQLGEGLSRVIIGKMWDLGKEKDAPGSSPDVIPAMEISPFLRSDGSEEERRKLIETKILSKAPLRPLSDLGYPEPQNKNNEGRTAEVKKEEAIVSAEHPPELTLLHFKDIEKWDLDKVLQKLEKQSKATSWPGEAESPSLSHEHLRAVTQSKLMAKLEELSRKQSKAVFSHWQRHSSKSPCLDKCQGGARDISVPAAPIKNDRSWIPAALCVPEPPTVYMDLRDTISQKVESLADETQSLSGSSSDDEEDMTGTTQNEGEGKMDEFSLASRYRNCTGKCSLLQQLRNFRKQMSQLPATEPNKRSQNLQQPDRTNQLDVRTTRQSLNHRDQSSIMTEKVESDGRNPLIDCVKGAAKPSGEFQKETKEETCSELVPAASPKKDDKESRIVENQQGGEQGKEGTMKWWFQEQLEKSKPQHSTNGKPTHG